MSLGWQTESALLPSKAKKITLDKTSMLGLQAIVLTQEQRRQIHGTQDSSRVNWRKRRGDQHEEERDKKDVFAERNRGVDERTRRDQASRDCSGANRIEASLAAKAELYDSMLTGRSAPSSSNVTLVDFNRKAGALAGEPWADDWADGEVVSEETFAAEYHQGKRIKEFIQSRVDADIGSTRADEPAALLGAKIKSQWEKTLSKEAKAMLGEGPVRASDKLQGKSEKEIRRERILRMQQQQEQPSNEA